MEHFRWPALLLILLILGGCASTTTRPVEVDGASVAEEQEKQREMALDYLVRLHRRLARVSYPLLKSAADLCEGQTTAGTGLWVMNAHMLSEDFRATAERRFKLSDTPSVLYVVPDSPAAVAGVHTGDRLLELGGKPLSEGEEAIPDYRERIREHRPGRPLRLRVARDDRPLDLRLQPDTICDYQILLVEQDVVNAFADGRRVGITKGILRFTETDQELALVVSHEIAHNAMQHIDAKRQNATGGLLLDILAAVAGVNTRGLFSELGGRAYSQEFEAEADYVGLYIMAGAGLPIDEAEHFWRRMAVEHPGNIQTNHTATHPATAERFLAIEKTAEEIHRKRTAGKPLKPETKEDVSGAE